MRCLGEKSTAFLKSKLKFNRWCDGILIRNSESAVAKAISPVVASAGGQCSPARSLLRLVLTLALLIKRRMHCRRHPADMVAWQIGKAALPARPPKKKKSVWCLNWRELFQSLNKSALFFSSFFLKSSYTFSFGLGTPLFSSVFFSVHGKSEAKTFQNLKARAIWESFLTSAIRVPEMRLRLTRILNYGMNYMYSGAIIGRALSNLSGPSLTFFPDRSFDFFFFSSFAYYYELPPSCCTQQHVRTVSLDV